MRLKTAIRHALTVAERLHAINGIIQTPECGHECMRVKRAWLFGSTARHRENPNDVDIIMETILCRPIKKTGIRRGKKSKQTAKVDRIYKRSTGIWLPKETHREGLRYLRGNMRMIRFHDFNIDKNFAAGRIMLYPRNDLLKLNRNVD